MVVTRLFDKPITIRNENAISSLSRSFIIGFHLYRGLSNPKISLDKKLFLPGISNLRSADKPKRKRAIRIIALIALLRLLKPSRDFKTSGKVKSVRF